MQFSASRLAKSLLLSFWTRGARTRTCRVPRPRRAAAALCVRQAGRQAGGRPAGGGGDESASIILRCNISELAKELYLRCKLRTGAKFLKDSKMSKQTIALVLATVGALFSIATDAFAPTTLSSEKRVASVTALDAEQGELTRRGAFEAVSASFLTAVVAGGLPSPACADVTNKVASTAAIRAVKRALKDLEKAEFACVGNQYTDAKEALRTPGLNEVRKNCLILIRGGEDGAEAENLKSAYEKFVKDLEALDSQASLGMRGRKKDIQLAGYYDSALASLKAFLEVGERSATIPLQESSE